MTKNECVIVKRRTRGSVIGWKIHEILTVSGYPIPIGGYRISWTLVTVVAGILDKKLR